MLISMIYYCYLDAEFWEESDQDMDPEFSDCSSVAPSELEDDVYGPTPEDPEEKAIVRWIVAFISLFQTLHVIPDRAIAWLIRFISILLHHCSRFAPKLQNIVVALPQSLHLRNKLLLNSSSPNITKYVVCPYCHSLHLYRDVCVKRGKTSLQKKCQSMEQGSITCNLEVLKRVFTKSGTFKLYPHKVYCYKNIVSSLQCLLLRPGFATACESTRRACHEHTTIYSDVYHGQVWKEFLKIDSLDFLAASFCYGLMLNIDWFQPYKHCVYSVGVIYLVLMNLPRSHRYKRQNILIVAVIPGPREPPLTMNSYLSPMVAELIQLWHGIPMKIHRCGERTIRAALLSVACDLPASKKVCGFLSHSANLGCSRCYCAFSEGDLQRNYSFSDRNEWRMRSNIYSASQ